MPCCTNGLTRRQVLASAAALPLAAAAASTQQLAPGERRRLRVQPVLVYQLFQRRAQTSWRSWGGLFTDQEVSEEKGRIAKELTSIAASAGYPIEFLPLRDVTTVESARDVRAGDFDVLLLYPASGSARLLESVSRQDRSTILFVRHRSGPVYEWYEIVHPRFLRKTVDEWGESGVEPADVVVDDIADVAWRLRALGGLKNTLASRILCLGGAAGWGAGGRTAPQLARQIFKMDLVEVGYDDLGRRLKEARTNDGVMRAAREQASAYLSDKNVKLETDRAYVDNAFVLTGVLRDMLREVGATAFTINNCMSTVMPIGETTACLPLSLLNDQGYLRLLRIGLCRDTVRHPAPLDRRRPGVPE